MIDIPDFRPLRITQSTDKAGRKQLDTLDQLIVVLPKDPPASAFRGLPTATGLARLLEKATKDGREITTTSIDNRRGTAITLAALKPGPQFQLLTWARRLLAESARIKATRLGLVIQGFEPAQRDTILAALIRAADAASFALPSYQTGAGKKTVRITNLKLLALSPRVKLKSLRAGHTGNNLARWLTALPPNKLNALAYRAIAQSLAKQHGLEFEFIDTDKLQRLGAGAFLAVAQGNAEQDAGTIHLRYRPSAKAPVSLALVGKGIIFDTGGNNLKPFTSMLEMHTDMQGSAVALGIAVELAQAGVGYGFDVWLAVTENRVSARAYKSQDVISTANGTTIQVIHTDAEGRMVLSDTLALAADRKPGLILDFATLTGTCISALTTRYSGVFSNRAGSVRDLLAASDTSGERVWPFPLDDDFDEPLKSDIADIKQCATEGAGDHILATRFLKRFVPDNIPWIHMDLSAGQHKGGLGAIPTDITGFGVAWTLALLHGKDPAELARNWTAE